jgi:DNA-binding FrmR family transcriptional regulator
MRTGLTLYTLGGIGSMVDLELPEETVADVTRRLRRIEGQVRGLQQMLAEGRDCRDVVTQLSAANKALEQAGFVIVAAGLTWCLEDPERSAAEGYELADVQKMFTKLA